MRMPGSRGQLGLRDALTYRADGTIASGSAPQLILPEAPERCFLDWQNLSGVNMWLEFGSARAHAVLTNGIVTSVVMDNVGFGFTLPPRIEFLGGGTAGIIGYSGSGQPGSPAPSKHAKGHALLSGGTVGSIVIDDGGAKYQNAPYVRITNDPKDPFGCADPSIGGGTGRLMFPGASLYDAHISVPTDQMAVFCGTATSPFFCRYF
jgi:hypothetical protein